MIELLFFQDCPNSEATLNRLREVLTRKGRADTPVTLVEIDDTDKALEYRFLGSPTVRINGEDVDPSARMRTNFGVMCRMYRSSEGLNTGVPSVEMLEKAIDAHLIA